VAAWLAPETCLKGFQRLRPNVRLSMAHEASTAMVHISIGPQRRWTCVGKAGGRHCTVERRHVVAEHGALFGCFTSSHPRHEDLCSWTGTLRPKKVPLLNACFLIVTAILFCEQSMGERRNMGRALCSGGLG
jgi:hypothetical protein